VRVLHDALDTQHRELLAQLGTLDRSLHDLRDARSGGDADDEHDPEGPTLSSEWSRMSGLDASFRGQLTATAAALERVADGTYGTCSRCGRPIGFDRLEARPAADLCIECARLTA
jgi:DnaK suppressor protein